MKMRITLKNRHSVQGSEFGMAERTYTVQIVAAEEGGLNVFVPALPGCHTQAESCEQAIICAKEAIQCYLEMLIKIGESIPRESRPVKRLAVGVTVRLPERP